MGVIYYEKGCVIQVQIPILEPIEVPKNVTVEITENKEWILIVFGLLGGICVFCCVANICLLCCFINIVDEPVIHKS